MVRIMLQPPMSVLIYHQSIYIQNQPRMSYAAIVSTLAASPISTFVRPCGPCTQVDIGLAARVDTMAAYDIRGWFSIYYTFQAFKSIYLRYLPYLSRYGTRHVVISLTEKTPPACSFSLRHSPLFSVRWRSHSFPLP